MTMSNYAPRLQRSLKKEAAAVAKAEGTTLNQFINVAVAEKLSALRTEDYFRERRSRADTGAAKLLLKKREPTNRRARVTKPGNRRSSIPRFHHRPGQFRPGSRQIALLRRFGRRCVALDAAVIDALHDGGEAEQA